MKIISHRGYWKEASEKNTVEAFERSFSMGYGTETDIRDCAGKLVISHDMPSGSEMTVDDFFSLYNKYDSQLPLALNIKSDGLQEALKELLAKHKITSYFFFDMSLPDTLGYLRNELVTFARFSEYEKEMALWDEVDGIWLDGFQELELDIEVLESKLSSNKMVCVVSPELHKRSVEKEWSALKKLPDHILNSPHLILCTDVPEKAEEYFLS